MLFTTTTFALLFLPFTLIGFFAIGRWSQTGAAAWLLAASLLFYGYWMPAFTLLLVASIAANFWLGLRIQAARGASMAMAQRWLVLGVMLDLGLLAYFKYANFFAANFEALLGWRWDLAHIILPIGISFYTFTQIAFLADAYQGKVGETRYAMGGPGSSLLDYAERIRYAHQRLGVHDFVVLMEAGDVRQSLCGSGNVHSPCLDPTTLALQHQRRVSPSALARVARESALAQYFVGHLRLSVGSLLAQTFRRGVPVPTVAQAPAAAASAAAVAVPAFVDAVADRFFDRVRPQVTGRLVILVDGARDAKRPLEPRLAAERRRFIQRAREAGAVVVDTEALFAEHAGRSRRSLDVGPYDGHLNPLGVALVMTAAAQVLR